MEKTVAKRNHKVAAVMVFETLISYTGSIHSNKSLALPY